MQAHDPDPSHPPITATYDGFGNLKTRTDSTHSTQESSEHETYDALNRLTKSVLSGAGTTQTFHYADSGNLTYRSDRGTYTYGAGAAGPHAVTQVAGITYNANGEMRSGDGRSYSWSAFGKAKTITQHTAKGTTTVSFAYGPGGARTQKTMTGVSATS